MLHQKSRIVLIGVVAMATFNLTLAIAQIESNTNRKHEAAYIPTRIEWVCTYPNGTQSAQFDTVGEGVIIFFLNRTT